MAAHSKLWYLQQFRLMDALTDAQKQSVDKMARMLELERGQRIYLPGDPSDQVFLVKTGVVKISSGDVEHDTILALLYPGDIFGELAILDDQPRDHVAEVVEDTVLCALNRDKLLQLIQQSPALGYRITKLMGLRLRRLGTRVEELLYKSAHARIANTLLDLARDYGVNDDDGILIPIRLNQGDVGNLVGLARETVNIVLQDLKQRGLVEATRANIRIKDPERLRAVT
jgi:CRP-like cAMP-binding protein